MLLATAEHVSVARNLYPKISQTRAQRTRALREELFPFPLRLPERRESQGYLANDQPPRSAKVHEEGSESIRRVTIPHGEKRSIEFHVKTNRISPN